MIKLSSSTAAVTRSTSSFEIMSSDATSIVDNYGADEITNSNVSTLVDAAIVISLPATIGDSNNDIDQVALLSVSNSDEEQGIEDTVSIETLTKPDCCKFCCTTLVIESPPRMGNFCCALVVEPQRIGNCRVIFPQLYQRTGFGIVGPHWVGFLSTLTLVIGAGALVTRNAVNISATKSVGSVKPILCIIFTAITSILLCLTGCSNPGIVTEANCGYTGVSSGREWRWCQVCRVHQPPKAVHCPDCNVCIAEYDHHCPWMGTCIGKRNFRLFVQFNIAWLMFLMFFIAFIAFQHGL